MTVGRICNRDVVVTRADDTIQSVAGLMKEYHIGDIVVVEEQDGGRVVPLGIVTDRDVVVEVIAAGVAPEALSVGDITLAAIDAATSEAPHLQVTISIADDLPFISADAALSFFANSGDEPAGSKSVNSELPGRIPQPHNRISREKQMNKTPCPTRTRARRGWTVALSMEPKNSSRSAITR